MTRHHDLDRAIEEWLIDGPSQLPERALERIVSQLDQPTQRRQRWLLPGRRQMNRMLMGTALTIALAVVGVGLGAALVGQQRPAAPTASVSPSPRDARFTTTGPLPAPRSWHAAVRLNDGRVLVTGGGRSAEGGGAALDSLDAWDALSGRFSSAGRMTRGRARHSATLLPNGSVLIVGGDDDRGTVHDTAELWDPQTGLSIEAGRLLEARTEHTATLLPDDRVLVVGGHAEFAVDVGAIDRRSAEIWDPITRTFEPAGTMATARWGHTATLLNDGRVLVVGGGNSWQSITNGPQAVEPEVTAELWDPASGSFGDLTTESEPFGPFHHSATMLEDGRVLIVGSQQGQVYDPLNGFAPVPIFAGDGHTATLLADGTVLLVGGGVGEAAAHRWDPDASDTWKLAGTLARGRAWHSATLLADGSVLVAGGYDYLGTPGPNDPGTYEDLASAELWQPPE